MAMLDKIVSFWPPMREELPTGEIIFYYGPSWRGNILLGLAGSAFFIFDSLYLLLIDNKITHTPSSEISAHLSWLQSMALGTMLFFSVLLQHFIASITIGHASLTYKTLFGKKEIAFANIEKLTNVSPFELSFRSFRRIYYRKRNLYINGRFYAETTIDEIETLIKSRATSI